MTFLFILAVALVIALIIGIGYLMHRIPGPAEERAIMALIIILCLVAFVAGSTFERLV